MDAMFVVLYCVFSWSEAIWLLSVKSLQRQRLYKRLAEVAEDIGVSHVTQHEPKAASAVQGARRGRRYESLYCICTATNRHRYGVTSAHNPMAGKRDTWSKVEVCSVIAVCVWEYSAVHVIKLELMLDQQRSWIPNTSTTHDKRRADVLTRR